MPEPPTMRFIREHIRSGRYRLTRHATIVRLERGISIAELEQALLNGQIIELNRLCALLPFMNPMMLCGKAIIRQGRCGNEG